MSTRANEPAAMTPERAEANLGLLHRIAVIMQHLDDDDGVMYRPQADGSIIPWVLCNDVFGWACSDGEDITMGNVHLFEQAARDYESAYPLHPEKIEDLHCNRIGSVSILFACYARNQRPFKHNGTYGVAEKLTPFIEALPKDTP